MAKKAKVKRKSKRTARESQFIQEYLIDLNGSAAIKRAGYKGKYAAQAAFELLRKPYVIAEINAAMQKRAKKLELTGEFTLSRLKDLASSNIKNVAEWAEGSLILKDSAAITSEEAYGIESIQVKQTLRGPELKVKMRQPSVAL
ncbi:MAG: terminase small subunit, partial [Bdellovibrionota bacterium]